MTDLETRIADAYATAPDDIKAVLADALKAVQQRNRLVRRLQDIATSAASAAEYP